MHFLDLCKYKFVEFLFPMFLFAFACHKHVTSVHNQEMEYNLSHLFKINKSLLKEFYHLSSKAFLAKKPKQSSIKKFCILRYVIGLFGSFTQVQNNLIFAFSHLVLKEAYTPDNLIQ